MSQLPSAIMAGELPQFGFVFDIDGVLIRGWDLLPNAKDSLKKVHDSGVPYLFVTNNGMDTEDERAKILNKQFDIPVTNKNMVLNHSALQVCRTCSVSNAGQSNITTDFSSCRIMPTSSETVLYLSQDTAGLT